MSRISGESFWKNVGALVARSSMSGDGKGIDVWVGSLKTRAVTGIACTVDNRKKDAEIKILIGCSRAERQKVLAFHSAGNQAAILIEPG